MNHAEPLPSGYAFEAEPDAHDDTAEDARSEQRRLWPRDDANHVEQQETDELGGPYDEDDLADGASEVTTPLGPGIAANAATQYHQRRRRSARKQSRDLGLKKKYHFLTHLLAALDSLVFIELGALYYHECSFFRFCVRAIPQFLFLAPKSDSFPFLVPVTQSHVVSIFAPNLLCTALHLFAALPRARAEHRGYLHGGIFVDFIGQRAPTSRLELLALDAVVLVLQCFLLAVHSDRERLRGKLRHFEPLAPGEPGGAVGDAGERAAAIAEDFAASSRSLDAAERGEAGGPGLGLGPGLGPGLGLERPGERGSEDSAAATDNSDMDDQDQEGPFIQVTTREEDGGRGGGGGGGGGRSLQDELSSGIGILGEYNILHTMQTASMDYESTAAHSLRTLGYTAAITRWAARRGSMGTSAGDGQ